jgi:hypothetical protein
VYSRVYEESWLICVHQIRPKSPAELQAVASNSHSPAGPSPASPPAKPKPKPLPSSRAHTPKNPSEPPAVPPKAQPCPRKLDLQSWAHEMLSSVFEVSLQVSEILYLAFSSNSELPCNLERGGRKEWP